MRASKPLTITLPQKMADEVKARVASGDYASESEVIREGLRALAKQEEAYNQALEHWLQTEGKKRAAEYAAGQVKTVPMKEAFARVKANIGKRAKKS
jgi:antitoxin ParD1/3/4